MMPRSPRDPEPAPTSTCSPGTRRHSTLSWYYSPGPRPFSVAVYVPAGARARTCSPADALKKTLETLDESRRGAPGDDGSERNDGPLLRTGSAPLVPLRP